MNDVLALLLSISEDPTVDFTYRLSALKALTQIEGQTTADGVEHLDVVAAQTTATAQDWSAWWVSGGHRFSPN